MLGRFPQRVAEFLDGCIETVVKIHKGIRGPQLLLQFFPGDDVPLSLQQKTQHLKRLLLESDSHSMLPQLTGSNIHFVVVKPKYVDS
jgi:hypothetical protein